MNINAHVGANTQVRPYCKLLPLLLLCPTVGMAQNGVTISNFAAAPGKDSAPTTLSFNIQWSPPQGNKVRTSCDWKKWTATPTACGWWEMPALPRAPSPPLCSCCW